MNLKCYPAQTTLLWFILIIGSLPIGVWGQSSSFAVVKDVIEHNSPCGLPLYCYEYGFEVKDNDIILTMRLFNTEERILTETTIYKLPVNTVKTFAPSPYNQNVYSIATTKKTIERNKNGMIDIVDLIILDFDPYSFSNELKRQFQTSFNALIEEMR